MLSTRSLSRVAALAVAGGAVLVAAPAHAAPKVDPAVAFWTNARVAKAIPRDFEYDPATKQFHPAARPGGGGGGGGTTTVTGASWTADNAISNSSGKVLFALGSTYYVCSANVVNDNNTGGRSLIVTAGHCAYDETNGGYATNWVFIPDYDAAPAPLSTSNTSYCASTKYGCWSAFALVNNTGFTSAGSFNQQATTHDFAFAVVGAGGKSGTAELDQTVPTQAIAYNTNAVGQQTYNFGYPAAGRYHGNDLVYCAGKPTTDALNNNLTYGLGCNMTGGSSGGPWLTGFNTTTGTGTQVSLNSYGYSGITAMYGPMFNGLTQQQFAVARTTGPGNVAVAG
jgi:hypothetical protein